MGKHQMGHKRTNIAEIDALVVDAPVAGAEIRRRGAHMPTEAGTVQHAAVKSVVDAVELSLDITTECGATRRVQLRMPRGIAQAFALKLVQCAAKISCAVLGVLSSFDEGLVYQANDLIGGFC